MLIKRFEESDAVDVLETFLVSWISMHHDKYPGQVYEKLVSRITLDYVKHFGGKKRFCLVAREHRQVSGFIYCKTGKLYANIEEFYVRPEKKRAGVGSELLDKACHELHQRNQLKVRATVLATNQEALAFYRKHGFLVVKRALNRERGGVLEIEVEKNLGTCR